MDAPPWQRMRGRGQTRLAFALITVSIVLGPCATWAAGPSALSRRRTVQPVLLMGASVLGESARAETIDLYSLVLRKKKKCLPTIVDGYKTLKNAGEVTDDFIEKKLTKMVKYMREFGDANRVTPEYEDDVVKRLKKELSLVDWANTFKAYAIDKEYSKAMKTLEKYRKDVPFGVGVFEWDDEMSTLAPE
eukprot:s399_g28.t1